MIPKKNYSYVVFISENGKYNGTVENKNPKNNQKTPYL
ncbi:hypothetical protein BPUTSESOX_2107 [uncultured Gammaproteobacteria bacterium]|nr:hypothetical protein BPUTSESOX_2107 [uncultured Gammaproteobacteria bacterium]